MKNLRIGVISSHGIPWEEQKPFIFEGLESLVRDVFGREIYCKQAGLSH